MSVRILLLLIALQGQAVLAADADPLQSVMWEYHHKGLLNGEPYVFDERVQVQVPPFAEDSRQVPIHVDARALGDEVVR
ncbi:MAG TPA: quinoprotein dehydrogenase-associated SoxYZ-like carrier, partial [Pseudomonas sp.]|nr:quinoprotein dehydrogenase-associated SoxYZ-like carrier [Pseudomonas sp.]